MATVSNKDDHDEISYRPHCSGKYCIAEIIEDRWEDGSGFQIFDGGGRILRLREASPYWGYRQDKDLSVFFLDYPPPYPGMEKGLCNFIHFAPPERRGDDKVQCGPVPPKLISQELINLAQIRTLAQA